jgi:DNA polymerase (family 10)
VDAHNTAGLANIGFGISVARKAGLQGSDVVNTLGADDFLAFARRRR